MDLFELSKLLCQKSTLELVYGEKEQRVSFKERNNILGRIMAILPSESHMQGKGNECYVPPAGTDFGKS